jgi:hypothetical protein
MEGVRRAVRYFKEMCKAARENGVGSAYNPKNDDYATREFFRCVETCEVFVYADRADNAVDDIPDYPVEQLDAPFPVFSIEMQTKPIVRLVSPSGGTSNVHCVMVAELSSNQISTELVMRAADEASSPALFVVFCLVDRLKGGKHVMLFRVSEDHNRRIYDLVRSNLDRLAADKDGVEEVPDVVMLPAGKNGTKKKPHPIRRIFHVVPRNMYKRYGLGPGREIDWTHRWSVRGHWVHFTDKAKVGKNRAGEYVERGRTWRSEHEKGPEDKVLVKKTRLVKESE